MNTTKLNKNTKKAKAWIDSYFMSHKFSVRDCYTTRAYTKEAIEDKIKERIYNEGMTNYKIISYNCMFFTCGYTDKSENILYIETHCNIYKIPLTD